jgi:hypothetical protein
MSAWLDTQPIMTAASSAWAETAVFLDPYWTGAKAFFNSAFFTAIAGSLAGAFFGAYAAQRIAERNKTRDELLKEIRNTNASIMLSFDICNCLLSAKKQFTSDIKDKFYNQRNIIVDICNNKADASAAINKEIEFGLDFRTLQRMTLPIDILQKRIFDNLSLVGRSISLVATLERTLDGLNVVIERRNKLIEAYKLKSLEPSEKEHTFNDYFGFRQRSGHIDSEYKDLIDGIESQTDDGIFFSQLLCRDLNEHGNELVAKFKKLSRSGAPRVNKPDFSKAEEAGLMPSGSKYTDWCQMFVKRTDERGE